MTNQTPDTTTAAALAEKAKRLAKELRKYGRGFVDGPGMFKEAAEVLAALAAAQARPAEPDLHAAIMNIRCNPDACSLSGINASLAYKQGHRDARHAAAELAAALHSPAAEGQEAVAWTALTSTGAVNFGKDWVFSPVRRDRTNTPLYLHPVQPSVAEVGRVPLKDAQIRDELSRKGMKGDCFMENGFYAGVTFAEIHHGITAPTTGEQHG